MKTLENELYCICLEFKHFHLTVRLYKTNMQVMISSASLYQLFSASYLSACSVINLCMVTKHNVKCAAVVFGRTQVWSLTDRYQAVRVLIN